MEKFSPELMYFQAGERPLLCAAGRGARDALFRELAADGRRAVYLRAVMGREANLFRTFMADSARVLVRAAGFAARYAGLVAIDSEIYCPEALAELALRLSTGRLIAFAEEKNLNAAAEALNKVTPFSLCTNNSQTTQNNRQDAGVRVIGFTSNNKKERAM